MSNGRGKQTKGKKILLLPGGFCYSKVLYQPLTKQSSARGWNLIYGEYYTGPEELIIPCGESMEDYYRGLKKLVSATSPDLIIGHSFSANVLLYYLAKQKPKEKLVIYAPSFHESHEDPLIRNITRYAPWMLTNRLTLSFFRALVGSMVSDYLVEGKKSPLYEEVKDMIKSTFNRETGTLIRAQLKAFFEHIREPLLDEWRKIQSNRDSVRLVYGDKDEIFKKLSKDTRFQNQEETISLIRGAGHMAVMEKPAEFTKIVKELLQ